MEGVCEEGQGQQVAYRRARSRRRSELHHRRTKNGVFVLVLIQRRKWAGSDAQLGALQKRLNEYAAFALDGELTKRYPEAEGKRVRIRLDIEHAPARPTKAFLRRIKAALGAHGIPFEVSLERADV